MGGYSFNELVQLTFPEVHPSAQPHTVPLACSLLSLLDYSESRVFFVVHSIPFFQMLARLLTMPS